MSLRSAAWIEDDPADWEGLAALHGTPYYLFDADRVATRIRAVQQAFGGLARVYLAVKSNPNLELLKALRPVADGADISSGGELAQVLLAGYDPARLSFAGPAKGDDELQAAIEAGVGCISAESLREIRACAAIAERCGRRASLLLRVNPSAVNRAFGLKMGGRAVQFGIDEAALPEAEALLREHARWIDFRGIHAYVGSQCFEASGIEEATANALRIAGELQARSGLVCREINLGGGFGVAHAEGGRTLDLPATAARVVPLLTRWREANPLSEPIFELGRFLTAEAGVYVTRVVDSKTSQGKAFHTCDGGLNHHLAAAGTFGAALRGNFPLRNLSRPDAPMQACNLAGPSCNPTDLLGVDVQLPQPQPGDLLGIALSGAYGLTASPLLFLGRRTPAEWVRSGKGMYLGRRPRPLTDFN